MIKRNAYVFFLSCETICICCQIVLVVVAASAAATNALREGHMKQLENVRKILDRLSHVLQLTNPDVNITAAEYLAESREVGDFAFEHKDIKPDIYGVQRQHIFEKDILLTELQALEILRSVMKQRNIVRNPTMLWKKFPIAYEYHSSMSKRINSFIA
ncbi:unnamed protein product [Soboliphyme baturini]|uniref:P4Ha_N domain-containing protein n=1 Tax=Soboliphyme baturini TaxID=241478 RepID=A0A183IX64_9BILA|nr:unnamed protein product [Soboliphyme baturini]